MGPPQQVGRERYRLGLLLFLVPVLMTWIAPYAAAIFGTAGIYGFLESRALEALLLVGLFLLGGDFWDKLGALFKHRATIEFDAKAPQAFAEPLSSLSVASLIPRSSAWVERRYAGHCSCGPYRNRAGLTTMNRFGIRTLGWQAPRCSAPARRSGPTSSDRRCPGWPTGRAARSSRWPPDPRAPRSGQLQEWWRSFNDPVLDQLVAEAQRVNPNVRTAGLRIMEARAQLGIAGSTLYPQVQQVTGELLGVGEQRAGAPDTSARDLQRRAAHQLGTRFLGQVQAQHRGRGCRLFRQHRPVR